MLRIHMETLSKRPLLRFMSKRILTALLVAVLFTPVWAQGVYSNGLGPRFSVSPAITMVSSNGMVTLYATCAVKNMVYAVVSSNNEEIFEGRYLNFPLKLTGIYEYVRVKGWEKGDRWESSVATVLVLSKVFKVERPLSVKVFNDKNAVLYTVLSPLFGRKKLDVYVDGELVMERKLSPYDDSPLIFEKTLSSLNKGKHMVSVKLTTISGIVESRESEFYMERNFVPKIENFKMEKSIFSPGKAEVNVSLRVTNPVKIVQVWINGEEAHLKNGIWQSQFVYDFSKMPNGKNKLPFTVKLRDEADNTTSLTVATTVYVNREHPVLNLVLKSGKQIIPLGEAQNVLRTSTLPISYVLEAHASNSFKTPVRLEIFVDGKSVGVFQNDCKTSISFTKYGQHTIQVKAIDEMNGLSTTKKVTLSIEAFFIPRWTFISLIIASLMVLLLLTFY